VLLPTFLQMPKHLEDVKIAILTCPFEPPKPKTKHKVAGKSLAPPPPAIECLLPCPNTTFYTASYPSTHHLLSSRRMAGGHHQRGAV
jgi:hypothetical protein